jgi:hypothetical protein
VGGDQNYIRDVTLDDVNNYTKKFSAYRRLGALHDSLIESLEEDGTESAADLLAARLKLIPKLRAVINQLSDQYKQWLSTAQSEIDTKYNVYISDLKATLKNITRINGAILLLGLEIESDETIVKFYEEDIKNLEAELKILDNTIVSLQQENQALAAEKETLTTELNAKKDSKAPEDIARVEQINTRLKSINAITNTNNVLIKETIPEKQNQTRIDQAKSADAKNLLEKKIVSKKDSIDPKVQANSLAALKSELEKANAKKTEIEKKIDVFLKSFNDSVGKYMGVVYSSQDRSSAGISYFNAMKSRDIKDPFDVTFMVTFNANHYGNKSTRGGTTAVNYSEFFVPVYQTSVEKKKVGLKEGEFYLSSKIANSINEDKALVVENISESLRTHFDAFIEVTLQSNFKTVPPLVVAIKALQNKIQSILDKEKQAGST